MPRLTVPSRARRGVTLIEVLVALTVFMLVAAALTGMFTSQVRMYGRTQESTRIQRDLRAGLSLLPMDLRGASRPGADLTSLVDSAVELRATIGASVVCERPSAVEVDVPPPDLARNVLTRWYADPQPGDTVLFYDDSVSFGPEDDGWKPRELVSVEAAPATSCVGPPFTDSVLDRPADKPRTRLTVAAALPAGVRVGAPLRFLRSVRYSLYRPAGSGTRWYLGYDEYVLGAWRGPEPIAGPFAASADAGRAGIEFAYYDSTGARLATPAVATNVARVDLTLRADGRVHGRTDTARVRDSISVRIALRNRW